ncbi:hypothetical protein LEP1GSC175_0967 [Leptospira santarosai str. HAI821]|nr:hypothetical protein LEP1GSC175_0967 [Leptospira santarosai str. HAI821]
MQGGKSDRLQFLNQYFVFEFQFFCFFVLYFVRSLFRADDRFFCSWFPILFFFKKSDVGFYRVFHIQNPGFIKT